MRQRSNLIILFGIAFFIVGGSIAYLVLRDDDSDDGIARADDDTALVSVFVATEDIAPNTLGSDAIEEGLLTTEQVSTSSKPPDAVQSAAGLANQIFAVGVSEGDVITTAQLSVRSLSNVPVPDGFDAVAVTLDWTPGGAGYIAPGDTVNVYGVYGSTGAVDDAGISAAGGDASVPRSELALTNVLVLAVSDQQETAAQTAAQVDQTQNDGTSSRNEVARPVTYLLALKPTDVERVVQLTSFANLYLSLTADGAPTVDDTPGIAGDSVNGPVSADSAARPSS